LSHYFQSISTNQPLTLTMIFSLVALAFNPFCTSSVVSCAGDVGGDDACRLRLRTVRIPAERRIPEWHLHGLQLRTLVSYYWPAYTHRVLF